MGFPPVHRAFLFLLLLGSTCALGDDLKSVFFSFGELLRRSVRHGKTCSPLSPPSTSHLGSFSGSSGSPSRGPLSVSGAWLWYAFIRHRRQHGWTCPQSTCALFSAFSRSVSGDAFVSWTLKSSTVSRLSPFVACLWHAQLPTCPFEVHPATRLRHGGRGLRWLFEDDFEGLQSLSVDYL